jgi:hypothetical protein
MKFGIFDKQVNSFCIKLTENIAFCGCKKDDLLNATNYFLEYIQAILKLKDQAKH